MSDVQIGAIEIKNHNTDDRAGVTISHELITESRVHDEGGTGVTSTLVGIKQGLDVNVVGGSALSVSEDEDGDVPANQSSVGLLINLNYGYDGVSWKRINETANRLHVDSILRDGAGTALTSTLVGGRQSLDVNLASINVGAGSASVTEPEDDAIAADVERFIGVNLQYGFGGTTWERIDSTSNALHVNIQSSVLPTGAATESTLTSIDGKITAVDTDNVTITGTLPAGTNDIGNVNIEASGAALTATGTSLNVNITGGTALEVDLDNANDDVLIYGQDSGATNRAIRTNTSGQIEAAIISSVLPTGAATESSLSSIDGTLDVSLSTRASESTLSSIDSNIDVLLSTRATEATLSTRASETTLSGFRTDFNAVDFATETTLGTLLTESAFQARINTLGQKASAASTPVVIASDQSTLPTDPTDDTAREIGRVSGSDTVHTEESYGTTDTDANARPTNGDFVTRYHKTKSIAVANTGANNARITVLASVDDGSNFDIVISNNTQVNAGNTLIVSEERAMTHIQVLARAATAGNQTTIVTRGYSLGT